MMGRYYTIEAAGAIGFGWTSESKWRMVVSAAGSESGQKQNERELVTQQAQIDKVKAEAEAQMRIVRAKAEAEEAKLMAKAHSEERKAEAAHITPLEVQMHAYDALGKLGGNGTTIYLGDWSRAPNFLFPPVAGLYGGGGPVKPATYK